MGLEIRLKIIAMQIHVCKKKWPPIDITRKYEKLCIVAFNRKFDYDDVIKMKEMSFVL